MSDLEQQRRTVRVLELLGDSYRAWAAGDMTRADTILTEVNQLDVDAVSVIHGGMLIGEIPDPNRDEDAYMQYVDDQRAALAAAEEDEGR